MPNRAPPPKCPPNRLTEIMRDYGMSPYKIRDRLRDDYGMDVSASTFYELAKGPAQLTHYYMLLLAEIIGCDPCDFMPEAPPPLSIPERLLLTRFRQMSTGAQHHALRIFDTFFPAAEAAAAKTDPDAVLSLPSPKPKAKTRLKKGAK